MCFSRFLLSRQPTDGAAFAPLAKVNHSAYPNTLTRTPTPTPTPNPNPNPEPQPQPQPQPSPYQGG